MPEQRAGKSGMLKCCFVVRYRGPACLTWIDCNLADRWEDMCGSFKSQPACLNASGRALACWMTWRRWDKVRSRDGCMALFGGGTNRYRYRAICTLQAIYKKRERETDIDVDRARDREIDRASRSASSTCTSVRTSA